MQDQTPIEIPTPAEMLEMSETIPLILNKLQSAKSPKEIISIMNGLTKKQVGSIKFFVLAGAIVAVFSAAIEAMTQRSETDNASMTTEQFANLFHHSGLSQTELAKALDIPQPSIAGWLNGSRPVPQKHVEKIHRICVDAAAKRLLTMSRWSPAGRKKAA